MAIEIGYAGKIEVAADTSGTAGTFTAVGGQAEGSIEPENNTADVTQLNQAGYDQTVPTTQKAAISLSCFYIAADAGQAIIMASLTGRTNMWIRVWRDASKYSLAYCFCTKFPTKIVPKDPVKVDVGLMFSGNPNGYTINNGLTGSPYAATVILGIA